MKKIICLCLTALLLFAMIPTMAAESEISVLYNIEKLVFDQPPINENGRVLVPFRVIFEAFGAEVEYEEWDSVQMVFATKGQTSVSLTIGKPAITVNGEEITLDVAPKILNGRTLVPVRAVSEALSAVVWWDGETQTVFIETPDTLYKIGRKTIEKEYTEGGKTVFKTRMTYPVFENAEGNATLQKLNSGYKKDAEEGLATIEKEWVPAAKEDAERITEGNEYFFLWDFDVTTNRNGIVSICEKGSNYTGGAHPNSGTSARTFNLYEEKELFLKDVLVGSDAEIKTLIQSTFEGWLEACESDEGIKESIRTEIANRAMNVGFYLTDDALVLFFQPYEVAPYAYGYPTVVIPYKGNEKLFRIDLSGVREEAYNFDLEGNPTTGYTWICVEGEYKVALTEEYEPFDTSEGIAGSGGTYHFTAKGLKPGNEMVTLVYVRPWESVQPLEIVNFYFFIESDGRITFLYKSFG